MSDCKIPLLRWESLFLFLFLGGVRGMWTLQRCDTVAPSQTFPDDCCPVNSVERPHFSGVPVSTLYGAPDMTWGKGGGGREGGGEL